VLERRRSERRAPQSGRPHHTTLEARVLVRDPSEKDKKEVRENGSQNDEQEREEGSD